MGTDDTSAAWARRLIQVGAMIFLGAGVLWISNPGPNFAQILFRWGTMGFGLVLIVSGVAVRYASTPRG